MKATLEFDLPEDRHDHEYALAGLDALLVIDDLLNEIRSAVKHNSGRLAQCDILSLEVVREFLCGRMDERRLPELI